MTAENRTSKRAPARRKQAAAARAAPPPQAETAAAAEAEAAAEAAKAEAAAAQLAALREKAAHMPDSMLPSSVPPEDRLKLKMMLSMFPPVKPGQIFVLPKRISWAYIFMGCFILWIQGLNQNIISTNLPKIEAYFHTSAIETTWLISAYMAPYASFTILLTKLRTQIGVRRFTIISLIGFTIASLFHVFLDNYYSALALRFFSGLTSAPLSSVAVLYIMTPLAPLKKMTAGISIAMLNLALGMPLSRLLGSLLFEISDFSAFCLLEFGLACIALALMEYLPPMQMPTMKVMEKMDFISYPLLAAGLGINAALLPVGRLYWWHDAQWMGWCFALAALCLLLSVLIELNRKNPLIDFRWLFSREMFQATIIIMTFRILISDQSTLLGSYYALSGLDNTNLFTLYLFIAGGIITGGLICVFFLEPGREDYFYLIGMAAIALGSYLDSFSTALTRPPQMYMTQMLVGFGTGLFMPTALSGGIYLALMRGSQYVVSFVAVFLFTQCTGSLMSSAFFGSLQIILEKFHSVILTAHLTADNPPVAERLAMLSAPYRHILTDPGALRGAGLGALARQASGQANILAYNDVYRVYFYIAAAILALLLIRVGIKEYYRFYPHKRAARVARQMAKAA